MNPFLSDERNTRIYRMRIAGCDYKQIAREVGVSSNYARQIYERYTILLDRTDVLAQFDPYMSRRASQKLLNARIATVEEAKKLTLKELRRLPLVGDVSAKEIYEGLHEGERT